MVLCASEHHIHHHLIGSVFVQDISTTKTFKVLYIKHHASYLIGKDTKYTEVDGSVHTDFKKNTIVKDILILILLGGNGTYNNS